MNIEVVLEWHRAGQIERAEAGYDEILRLAPEHADALRLLGICKLQRGDQSGALSCFDQLVRLQPLVAGHQILRADMLLALGRADEAVAAYDRAIERSADSFEAHNNRGNALRAMGDPLSALESFDRARRLSPRHPAPLNNQASALLELRRPKEALASCQQALALQADYADALYNAGSALMDLDRLEEATQCFQKVLQIEPQYLKALFNLGIALELLSRHADAGLQFSRLLELRADYPHALGHLIATRTHCCSWQWLAELRSMLVTAIQAGHPAGDPFTLMAVCDDPPLQRRCAQQFVAEELGTTFAPPLSRPRRMREKIRIAYASADFHDHATARLLVDVLERHDRERFEITGVSFGPDDASAMRARIVRSFDRFVDARETSDAEVANLLRASEIDIAIDLKGFTANSRIGIFARRAAPIQASFLGYPGTLGAPFIDYLIADAIVVPDEHRAAFSESVVYLPHCYQPNDSKRPRPTNGITRAEAGLPENAFVFCCFNNSYKITAEVFDVWMRMLARVPESVLWLLHDNEVATRNLRAEAQQRGIDPRRLVFAPRVAAADHLSRHALANLFLDTVPVNAHTTASDALWAGLPLLTCTGAGFASRVAASALHAIGLPELAMSSLEDYERLGVQLAQDRARMSELESRLERNRSTHPLFDADLFRVHLESAYRTMWELYSTGQPARDIRVQAQPATANDVGGRPARASATILS